MSEELKSCPFCGGNGKLIESHRYDASVDPTPPHWKVSCECIGCNGAAINIWRQTPEDAIEAWNSRHDSDDVCRLRNLLEDVVNILDLSDAAIEMHGPLGTEPAELVRLVLGQKDLEIKCLKAKFESDELPEWLIQYINEEMDRLAVKVASPYVINTFERGIVKALKWVLSLRRGEE